MRIIIRGIVVCLSALVSVSAADTFTWKAAASGNFQNASCWTGGVVPGSGDTAAFDVAGAYTVHFQSSDDTADLSVEAGDVTFDTLLVNHYTYALSGDAYIEGGALSLGSSTSHPLSLDAAGRVWVSQGGSLDVLYGSDVETEDLDIGMDSTGGPSSVVVDGAGSTLLVTGSSSNVYVGRSGATGNLTLRGGAAASIAGTLGLADSTAAGSTGNLTVDNATLYVGSLRAGTWGQAFQSAAIEVTGNYSELEVDGNGTVTLGAVTSGVVTANVSGYKSWLTTGTGLTTIKRSATVTVASGTTDGGVYIRGDALIDGGTIRRDGGHVMWPSWKTLTVRNGGQVLGLESDVPGCAISPESLTVTGTGSVVEVEGGLYVQSDQAVTVLSGGRLVTDATLNAHGGTLTVQGSGTTVEADEAYAGCAWEGGAEMSVRDGAQGQFQTVSVASESTTMDGRMLVESGASVAAEDLYMATGAGTSKQATLTVTGADSTFALTGAAWIGPDELTSSATVNVLDGGTFSAGTGPMTIEKSGVVNVNGGGTLEANGDVEIDGGRLEIASDGTLDWAPGHTMTVSHGGELALDSTTVPFASASVVVWGTDSAMTSSTHLRVKQGTDVAVRSGGRLQTDGVLYVGSVGTGTVMVEGGMDGAHLSSLSALVGYWDGNGTLTLRDDAEGTLTQELSVAECGTGEDTVGRVSVESGATLHVGSLRAGTWGRSGQLATISVTGDGSELVVDGNGTTTLGAASGSTVTVNVSGSGASLTTGTGLTTVNKTATVIVNCGALYDGLWIQGDALIDGGEVRREMGYIHWPSGKTMTVRNGGQVLGLKNASEGTISPESLTVTGTGSAVATAHSVFAQQDRAVTVSAGGHLMVSGTIGACDGTVTAEGPGTKLDADNASVGFLNGGQMSVRDGAQGDFGIVHVANASANFSGEMSVESGASVETLNLYMATGAGTNKHGTLTVTGDGSTFSLTGTGWIGPDDATSSAAVDILDGGTFSTGTGLLTIGSAGAINVNGGTLEINGPVDNGGAINLLAGTVAVGDFRVGPGEPLGADVVLGPGQTVAASGTTRLDGAGSLKLDGGTLSTGTLSSVAGLTFDRGRLELTGQTLSVGGSGLFGSVLEASAGQTYVASASLTVEADGLLIVDGGEVVSDMAHNTGEIVLRSATSKLKGDMFTNDGTVCGTGRIGASLTNGMDGEIRVAAGERLVLLGSGNVNLGRVECMGGEIEFDQGLYNMDQSGSIIARGAMLRFGDGLDNGGGLAVSGGVNDVTGDVSNEESAAIMISGGATVTFWDDVTNDGQIRVAAGSTAIFFGRVDGSGSFPGSGTIYLEGDMCPGSSPGQLAFGGDVVFGGLTSLEMELAGPLAGEEYDQLALSGQAVLDGGLRVVLLDGFAPQLGDEFQLIDGEVQGAFDSVSVPDLPEGLAWELGYASDGVSLQVVPEPASGCLLVGGVLLGLLRRRRRGIGV